MNNHSIAYPAPVRSDINAPLLDAWSRGELALQQCTACMHKVYFPRTLCPHCWSSELECKPLSGKGTIVSHSRIHKHVHAAFMHEPPTLLAEILLDEGWSMLARVVVPEGVSVSSGMRVELVPRTEALRFPLPTFALGE